MLQTITQLRHGLHAIPELSGAEHETKAMLISWLGTHTTLDIRPCGDGFYAAHREPDPTKPPIALRADYDAIPRPDGTAAHLCGHDGHAAALCGAALAAEGKTFGRNIFFLFQPAEETGAGAAPCCALFDMEEVSAIYGAHNLPGWPLGRVTTRPGTFACASRGVTLRLTGKPTHAAYPEQGLSPATAVGKLLCALPDISAPAKYTGMTLCTVIGVHMGEKAFGAAAEAAELWLTLRAEHDHNLSALQTSVLDYAQALADADRLTFTWEEQDVFPATENTPAPARALLTLTDGQLLDVPMRWSEDFGHYLNRCPGCFFGIGAGETHPGLHTETYEYPDALLEPTIEVFLKIMRL